MGKADYKSVLEEMRLTDGTLFPIPITLPIADTGKFKLDRDIALGSSKNELIAVMTVEEIFEWDLGREAQAVCGSDRPQW